MILKKPAKDIEDRLSSRVVDHPGSEPTAGDDVGEPSPVGPGVRGQGKRWCERRLITCSWLGRSGFTTGDEGERAERERESEERFVKRESSVPRSGQWRDIRSEVMSITPYSGRGRGPLGPNQSRRGPKVLLGGRAITRHPAAPGYLSMKLNKLPTRGPTDDQASDVVNPAQPSGASKSRHHAAPHPGAGRHERDQSAPGPFPGHSS